MTPLNYALLGVIVALIFAIAVLSLPPMQGLGDNPGVGWGTD
jgi:hypothetical protein